MITEIINNFKKQAIDLGHYDLRFLKPLDEKLLHHILSKYKYIITIEDGCIMGGMGSAILEFNSDHNYMKSIIRFGVPDNFIEHGTQMEQQIECGYNKEQIIKKIHELL